MHATLRPIGFILMSTCLAAAVGCQGSMHRDDMQDMQDMKDAAATTSTDAPAVAEAAGAEARTMPGETPASAQADRDFLTSALSSGMSEVALSRQVQSRSPTARIRALAEHIADDHDALNDRLGALLGASVTPGAEHRATEAMLASKQGVEIDQAYLRHMADGHRKAIALYEAAASSASNAAVRALAADALPKLREHAQAVNEQLAAAR